MFWNFTEVHCRSCDEPILVPLREIEVTAECPVCGEVTLVPPATPEQLGERGKQIRRVIYAVTALAAVLLVVPLAVLGWNLRADWEMQKVAALSASSEAEFQAEKARILDS